MHLAETVVGWTMMPEDTVECYLNALHPIDIYLSALKMSLNVLKHNEIVYKKAFSGTFIWLKLHMGELICLKTQYNSTVH